MKPWTDTWLGIESIAEWSFVVSSKVSKSESSHSFSRKWVIVLGTDYVAQSTKLSSRFESRFIKNKGQPIVHIDQEKESTRSWHLEQHSSDIRGPNPGRKYRLKSSYNEPNSW